MDIRTTLIRLLCSLLVRKWTIIGCSEHDYFISSLLQLFFVAFAIARLVLYSGICVRTPAVPDVSFAFLLEEPGANLSVEEIPLCWCPAAINTVLCFFAFVFFSFLLSLLLLSLPV